MKKSIVVTLVCLMVISAMLFAACGAPVAEVSAPAESTAAETSASSEEPASEESAESTEVASAEGVKIGFSFGQSVHPFFVAMQQGAEAAAKEAGVQLVVTTADYEVETQVSDVENLMQQGVKAIMVNPIDSAALSNVCNEALEKGIGIFPVDINVDNCEVTAFVSSDNKEIGKMEAEYIIEQLGGEGTVAWLGNPSITSLRDRQEGFFEVMDAQEGIEIVATNETAAIERTKALEAAETILQANPDLDCIAGSNESSALGALSAAQAAGKTDILITGVDATEDNLNAIKSGTPFSMAVAQDPYQMGYQAVQNALKWINGEEVEEFISVPIGLITADNVDEYIEREAQYAAAE
ncbi:sugar ABC transporter substrate-binding protein [Christensenella tenuis]|uniref:Sugar ABC transporter substrate-binding protein n=1 Tax=Christensenella tenuis TaxID=2763033 RepID=A0ABR7EHP6_9FIRM|nr:sugar ABC transporter substrate-binding protein [Christensenella tenuis]MBC5649263.1 sugar ABC transporter substrate-binding protein [Christensenella tenuis]